MVHEEAENSSLAGMAGALLYLAELAQLVWMQVRAWDQLRPPSLETPHAEVVMDPSGSLPASSAPPVVASPLAGLRRFFIELRPDAGGDCHAAIEVWASSDRTAQLLGQATGVCANLPHATSIEVDPRPKDAEVATSKMLSDPSTELAAAMRELSSSIREARDASPDYLQRDAEQHLLVGLMQFELKPAQLSWPVMGIERFVATCAVHGATKAQILGAIEDLRGRAQALVKVMRGAGLMTAPVDRQEGSPDGG